MLFNVLLNQFSSDCISLSFFVPPVNCPIVDIDERGSAELAADLVACLAARTSKTANTIFYFCQITPASSPAPAPARASSRAAPGLAAQTLN